VQKGFRASLVQNFLPTGTLSPLLFSSLKRYIAACVPLYMTERTTANAHSIFSHTTRTKDVLPLCVFLFLKVLRIGTGQSKQNTPNFEPQGFPKGHPFGSAGFTGIHAGTNGL